MSLPSVATRPIIYGEVLYDHFPDGISVLGGAPFNVAWHLRGLGEQPLFIGCVGDDETGRRVRLAMSDWGMDIAGLQTDFGHPTGSVRVEYLNGEPAYAILPDQAYDFIQTRALPDLADVGLLYHGSLALRQPPSRAALDALISRVDIPVFFDVNLRSPWWRQADISYWASRADWVKLNQDEWGLLSSPARHIEAEAREFIDIHELRGLVLTHGKAGAQVLTAEGSCYQVRPAPGGLVVDTVGAGDAFTAVFLLGQLHQWSWGQTLERAQDFASAMVGIRGATIDDSAFYQGFRSAWGLG